MFGLIQDDGVTYTWSSNGKNILNITFNSAGTTTRPANTLTITAHSDYDNKTLTDLMNDYIQSLNLFDTTKVINQIMDIIYGTISTNIGKSLAQLEAEAKVNEIIDRMVNKMNLNQLNDDAFTFTNSEINTQQIDSSKRKLGTSTLNINTTIPSTIPISSVTNLNEQINLSATIKEKKDAITNGLKNIADLSVRNVDNLTDAVSAKLNFIQEIINNLIKSIVNIILGPKVLLSFLMVYEIIYHSSQDFDFKDAVDFIKKNKKLMNEMMKITSEEIIKILLSIALKEINALVTESALEKQKEKLILKLAQLQSLVGVSETTIKNILNTL